MEHYWNTKKILMKYYNIIWWIVPSETETGGYCGKTGSLSLMSTILTLSIQVPVLRGTPASFATTVSLNVSWISRSICLFVFTMPLKGGSITKAPSVFPSTISKVSSPFLPESSSVAKSYKYENQIKVPRLFLFWNNFGIKLAYLYDESAFIVSLKDRRSVFILSKAWSVIVLIDTVDNDASMFLQSISIDSLSQDGQVEPVVFLVVQIGVMTNSDQACKIIQRLIDTQ